MPLPEAHLAGLGAGLLIEAVARMELPLSGVLAQAAGWALTAAGALLVAWAVRGAGEVNLDKPDALVRTGPYGFSRNPMYVGWTLAYAGISLVLRAGWPLLFLPAVLVRTHFAVRDEERLLAERFGGAYDDYRSAVRRWL